MAKGMRTIDEMVYELTGSGDLLTADISSTDYTVPAGARQVKGIITAEGTHVKVAKTNSDSTSVDTVLPAPGKYMMQDITKVYKTGTDSTHIYLVIEPLV